MLEEQYYTNTLGLSVVNGICGSMELICWRNCWLYLACWVTKVSSTCLSHSLGGLGVVLMALGSNSSTNRLTTRGLMGNPWLHHGPVQNTYPGRGNRYFWGKTPLPSISSNALLPPLYNRPPCHVAWGTQFTLAGMLLPPQGMPSPLHTSVYPYLHKYCGAIYGMCVLVSITFCFGPDEAMFDLAWWKLVFDIKLILFKQYKELHNNN